MLDWINYVLVVGICYILVMSAGVLVLLQWSPSSINNKQYTTQYAAAKVVQKYSDICGSKMGGYTYRTTTYLLWRLLCLCRMI